MFHYSRVIQYFVVGNGDQLGEVILFQITCCTLCLILFSKIWQRNLYDIYIFKASSLIICCYWNPNLSLRSNDYSHNDCKSPLKAILFNNVMVGKGWKLLQNDTTFMAPPAGYDSVGEFNSLNFDLAFGPDTAKMVLGPWGNRRNFEPQRAGRVH